MNEEVIKVSPPEIVNGKARDTGLTIFAIFSLILPLFPLVVAFVCQAKSGDISYPSGSKSNLDSSFSDAWWTFFLLSIPCLMHLLPGLYALVIRPKGGESFSYISGFSAMFTTLPYSIAWFLYTMEWYWEFLSYVWIGFVFIELLFLLRITYYLVHSKPISPAEEEPSSYFEGLRQMHFCAMLFYFANFLSIAYLAGFAFAFHDMANERHDMHMEPIKNVNYALVKADTVPQPTTATSAPINLYFNPSKNKKDTGAVLIVGDPRNKLKDPTEKASWKQIADLNSEALDSLDKRILTMSAHDKNKQIVITLTGRTDPKSPPKDVFTDNLALSNERIRVAQDQVRQKLTQQGYPVPEIQWKYIPLPSFDSTFSDKRTSTDPDNFGQRVVEIRFEESSKLPEPPSLTNSQPLKVIDYMYFSLYTITTTGYGDIRPVSAFSKFLCSVENMIEVFFLVIFVNVLISFKDSRATESVRNIETRLGALEENGNLTHEANGEKLPDSKPAETNGGVFGSIKKFFGSS